MSDPRDHLVFTERHEEDIRAINSKRILTDWWERVRTQQKLSLRRQTKSRDGEIKV